MRKGYAFFVRRPRIKEDLLRPHLMDAEFPYRIVKTIELSGIDYENFITDMRVDRRFLEDEDALYEADGATRLCLLVRKRRATEGVLIIPAHARVAWAAWHADP